MDSNRAKGIIQIAKAKVVRLRDFVTIAGRWGHKSRGWRCTNVLLCFLGCCATIAPQSKPKVRISVQPAIEGHRRHQRSHLLWWLKRSNNINIHYVHFFLHVFGLHKSTDRDI